MSTERMSIPEMIGRIDRAWCDFQASFDGLPEEDMLQAGVTEAWSVRDILAHVAVWDAYALDKLPTISQTGKHPDYEDTDTYNARMTEEKRGLSLGEVRQELEVTHRRLLDYLRGVSPESVVGNMAFRERLAADTWDHYPEHAAAIQAWREKRE